MNKRPREPDVPDIRALEMMLDYAIIEGAELRLPMFVLLLRAARLELMTSVGGDRVSRDLEPPRLRLAVLGDGLDGRPSLLQDR
jgi:hypothetical protein